MGNGRDLCFLVFHNLCKIFHSLYYNLHKGGNVMSIEQTLEIVSS